MFGIPDLSTPRLSFYEFVKLLFLPTVILMSWIEKSQSNGRGSLQLLYIPEFGIIVQCSQKISFRAETFFL